MRALVQRVLRAEVTVEKKVISSIDSGILVFLGFHRTDSKDTLPWLVDKLIGLRLFEDEAGKMNLDVRETKKSILIVSQFTLYGNCQKGRRPSFIASMPADEAERLYTQFIRLFTEQLGVNRVKTGVFGADMAVSLVNDGPATFLIESAKKGAECS